MSSARAHASDVSEAGCPWSIVVGLGILVSRSFSSLTRGGTRVEPLSGPVQLSSGSTFVSLPHPSGRNLAWNDPSASVRARSALRDLDPEVPWGELIGDAVVAG